jgi:hypothetical protein
VGRNSAGICVLVQDLEEPWNFLQLR